MLAAHLKLLAGGIFFGPNSIKKAFNASLVLLVVTSLLGPVLTELFTPGMITAEEARTKPAMA
jgi:hypothetical protein